MSPVGLLQRSEADRALAARDPRLTGLPFVLDDGLLSGLLGEPVRVTRVRYKPGTSALVAFRRDVEGTDGEGTDGDGDVADGTAGYGWAMIMAHKPALAAKLQRRVDRTRRDGGVIRLLHPDPSDRDIVVAVGRVEEDWPLRANLCWLREHGHGRLGVPRSAPGHLLAGSVAVLRYKPERRVVITAPAARGRIVVKIAESPGGHGLRSSPVDVLLRHGVPVLPELADAECLRHGISAAPFWGDGDLSGSDNNSAGAACRAGAALATLHGLNAGTEDYPGDTFGGLERRLLSTRSMLAALTPELGEPAALVTRHLLTRLDTTLRLNRRALVHGDFSPDQVLVRDSAIRIIDFDRITCSDPAADLGSFAASEEIADGGRPGAADGQTGGSKTSHLIDGYRASGGQVSAADVDIWAALRFFLCSVDPFRDRSVNWPADTDWHLRRALELIT